MFPIPSSNSGSSGNQQDQSSLGSQMFGGMGQQGQQPPPSSPDENKDATGMAKAVASTRSSLMELAKSYPEFSKLADEMSQKMIDIMYKSMTKQDQPKKEGSDEV